MAPICSSHILYRFCFLYSNREMFYICTFNDIPYSVYLLVHVCILMCFCLVVGHILCGADYCFHLLLPVWGRENEEDRLLSKAL